MSARYSPLAGPRQRKAVCRKWAVQSCLKFNQLAPLFGPLPIAWRLLPRCPAAPLPRRPTYPHPHRLRMPIQPLCLGQRDDGLGILGQPGGSVPDDAGALDEVVDPERGGVARGTAGGEDMAGTGQVRSEEHTSEVQ